jgi:hypothetical protein
MTVLICEEGFNKPKWGLFRRKAINTVQLACNNLDYAITPAAVQSGNPVQRGVEEDASRLRRNFIKASNRVLFACW